jgi:hypothetical protein
MRPVTLPILIVVAWAFLGGPPPLRGEGKTRDPVKVAAELDRLIDQRLAAAKVPASPRADDAEFLRRAYLDITGRIPPLDKAAAFLDSQDPDRRRKLIDELLADPRYGEHFGTLWHHLIAPGQLKALLNEQPVESEPLARWLAEQFNRNRGWDAIVTDILTSEGVPAETPQMFFTLVNGDARGHPQPSNLARNTAKLFLGLRKLECAECHDHPYADWKQTDFWGLAGFFGRVRKDFARHRAPIYELSSVKGKGSLDGTSKISADALTNVGKVVRAKYLNGPEATLDLDKPFRPLLAAWVTSTENPYFAPAAVNRLWAHFFGRGLVDPVDDLDADNPPSHPEVLKLLSAEFIASGFDRKHLIRCLCNTAAYQRSSRPLPGNRQDQTLFSRMAVKVLSPEMLADSLTLALQNPELFSSAKPPPKKGQPPVLSERERFLLLFATEEDGDPTEFNHGMAQALVLMNQAKFNSGTLLVDRLMTSEQDPERIITALYLATLSRRPGTDEMEQSRAFVARKQNPRDGYHGVLWTLINRSEFILNH